MLCWDGTGLWVLTNTHDPHCSHWFIKTPLSVPSPVRQGDGSFWRRRRRTGPGLCPASEQHHTRRSCVDVR
jgi:hypothetical protein